MAINPKNILNLLQENFKDSLDNPKTIITKEEIALASYLVQIMKDALDYNFYFESSSTLICEDEGITHDVYAVVEDFEDDFEEIVNDNKRVKVMISLDYKKEAVKYWKSGKTGKKKFETVQNQFKKLKDLKTLYRWEKQIEGSGTKNDKMLQIGKYVINQFQGAYDKSLPIHDNDLKRWALVERDCINLSPKLFSASSKWIYNFKKKHRIVSRKINKFITQSQIENRIDLLNVANQFVSEVKTLISVYGADNVFNSDQSGFNLETHTGRTLSFKGDSKIEILAQSTSSLTHSYTIQPFVTVSGLLKSPLLIVLKEPGGKFGPIVQKSIYTAENIVAVPSTSGKLTSKIVADWYKNIFLQTFSKQSVLCLDSWTGQTKKIFENIHSKGKKVQILTIPPGTTGLIQPLDIYGFRPWKNFVKCLSDFIILHGCHINLHLRNNILKIQSLTHNQFSSPRFVNLFKYSCYKSGYVSQKPPKCETPVSYCFQGIDHVCKLCDKIACLRCAWCTNYICLDHFFDPKNEKSPHLCKTFRI